MDVRITVVRTVKVCKGESPQYFPLWEFRKGHYSSFKSYDKRTVWQELNVLFCLIPKLYPKSYHAMLRKEKKKSKTKNKHRTSLTLSLYSCFLIFTFKWYFEVTSAQFVAQTPNVSIILLALSPVLRESESRILLSTKLPKWVLSNHYSGVSKHSTISPYAWSQQGPPLMTSVSSSDLMKRSTRQDDFQVISGFNEINVWGLHLKACSIWQNISGIVMHSYGSDWLCKITSQPMNGTLTAVPKW